MADGVAAQATMTETISKQQSELLDLMDSFEREKGRSARLVDELKSAKADLLRAEKRLEKKVPLIYRLHLSGPPCLPGKGRRLMMWMLLCVHPWPHGPCRLLCKDGRAR